MGAGAGHPASRRRTSKVGESEPFRGELAEFHETLPPNAGSFDLLFGKEYSGTADASSCEFDKYEHNCRIKCRDYSQTSTAASPGTLLHKDQAQARISDRWDSFQRACALLSGRDGSHSLCGRSEVSLGGNNQFTRRICRESSRGARI